MSRCELDNQIRSAIRLDGGHWLWAGSTDRHGRPVVHHDEHTVVVRRWLWEQQAGVPAGGLVVRRTCSHSACVRPAHARATGRGASGGTVTERLARRLVPTAGGCLLVDGQSDARRAPAVDVDGRRTTMARALWQERVGPVPPDLRVARTCEQLACVAPAHLYLTTALARVRATAQRGGFAGEAHWNHKLTEDQVRQIRAEPATPATELAARYHVSSATIGDARARRHWAHL
ncbi:hypothetical protein [Streptacidiphilus sp. PAMC 29251]